MASAPTDESSDEVMRKLLKPNTTPEQVIDVLRKSYASADENVTITIKRELDSYDDQNYWVTIGDTDYLAKVHNGVESKDLLDCSQSGDVTTSVIYLQNAMMAHLVGQGGVATSEPQTPTNSGDTDTTTVGIPASVHNLPVVSADHSPCPLVVRLMSWVPGRPMEAVKLMPLESLADAGRFLGKMQQALAGMGTTVPSAAKRYHQWDGKNTKDLTSFVSCITDDSKRQMVESVIDTFTKELLDSKITTTEDDAFPKALIHGDFNDANILVNDDLMVSGVIDFGDSVESWRVLDLSVAMAYAMMTVYGKKQRAISAAAAFLRGYSTVITLTKEERQHLVLLIACRLSCSATLGAYSYQQTPENEYLLLHAVPAWNTLNLIWGGTDETKRAKVRVAMDRVFDLAIDGAITKTVGEGKEKEDEVIDCSDLAFPDPSVSDPLKDLRESL